MCAFQNLLGVSSRITVKSESEVLGAEFAATDKARILKAASSLFSFEEKLGDSMFDTGFERRLTEIGNNFVRTN